MYNFQQRLQPFYIFYIFKFTVFNNIHLFFAKAATTKKKKILLLPLF